MISILKIELKRSLLSKAMFSIIIIGLILHIVSSFYILKGSFYLIDPDFHPNTTDIEELKDIYWDKEQVEESIKMTFNRYKIWYDGIWNYGIFIPLISCLPYSYSYLEDKKSGFFNLINTRVKNKNYLYSKLISNAIAGGIAVSLPTLLYGLIIIIFFKNEATRDLLINPSGPFSELFKTNPNIYIIFFSFMEFLAGAMYATMGMAISSFINRKVITIISPLIISNIQSTLFRMIGLEYFTYFIMFGFHVIDIKISSVVFLFSITMILSSLAFFIKGRKDYTDG